MEKANKGKSSFRKFLKWTSAILVIIIIFLFSIPSIFNDTIANEIKKGINENLETEIQFKESRISFFDHFPSLTFSFENVNLGSSKPFEKETLINAKELGFGINVFKLLFSNKVVVEETYLTDGNINLIKDKFGRNNYDVYKVTDTLVTTEKDTTGLGLDLNFRRLKIKNATVLYQDADLGITIGSNGFNYNGRGGLVDGKLELGSRLDIDGINVVFDNIEYLKGKKLKARSFTIYDTENLSIELDKNTISLNDLGVDFHGKLNVFDDGLAYNLIFNTKNGTVEDVMSALPPKYSTWAEDVTLKGDLDATLSLAGYTGTVPKVLEVEQIDLDVDIHDGSIKHKNADQALEDLFLKFNGSLKDNWIGLKLDSLNFTLNNEITRGHMFVQGSTDSLYVKSNIKSDINLDILNQTLNFPDLGFKGVLYADIDVDGIYKPATSKLPQTKGIFKLTDGFLQTSGHPQPIKNIELSAVVENKGQTYTESSLTIDMLNFSFLENQFTANVFIKDFDNPEYSINSKGTIDFTTLNQVVDLPFIISNGQLTADVHLKGQLNNPEGKYVNRGTLDIMGVMVQTDMLQYPVLVKEGRFSFLNDKMAFSKLVMEHKSTNVTMNGYFQDYMDYAISSEGVLRGDVNLQSPKIDITEFFPKEEIQQPLDSVGNSNTNEEVVSGVVQLPENVDLTLHVKLDSLTYDRLDITGLAGDLAIIEQALFLKNSNLYMVDGTASLEGYYKPISKGKALFSMDIKAKDLNIEKAYNSIDLFKELAPAAEQAAGIMSTDYIMTGTLDDQMLPVLPELQGNGILQVHSVQFNGYKLLGRVSEKSGFEALNNPKVSEITIKSKIKNNVLELERFKFKVSPFNLRAEGQTTLDGKLSLKMRIGLPPFGLLGIPVVIEGDSEDFDVKLGSKSPDLNSLDNTEESYSEDDLLRMSLLKDSIRDGMSVDEINKLQLKIESMPLDSLRIQPIDTLHIAQ